MVFVLGVDALDGRPPGTRPWQSVRMRWGPDDHHVDVGHRRVDRANGLHCDVMPRAEPGSDCLGDLVRVAVHGLVCDDDAHGTPALSTSASCTSAPGSRAQRPRFRYPHGRTVTFGSCAVLAPGV